MVVTGIGIVCSLGADVDELWKGLLSGRSGIGPVTRFDPERFRSRLAAEIDDSRVTFAEGPLRFEIKRMSGFVRYALFAAEQALTNSGLTEREGGGVYLGVAMGGLPSIEAGVLRQEQEGTRRTSPFLIPSLIPNMAASMIALRQGIEGEQVTVALCV